MEKTCEKAKKKKLLSLVLSYFPLLPLLITHHNCYIYSLLSLPSFTNILDRWSFPPSTRYNEANLWKAHHNVVAAVAENIAKLRRISQKAECLICKQEKGSIEPLLCYFLWFFFFFGQRHFLWLNEHNGYKCLFFVNMNKFITWVKFNHIVSTCVFLLDQGYKCLVMLPHSGRAVRNSGPAQFCNFWCYEYYYYGPNKKSGKFIPSIFMWSV